MSWIPVVEQLPEDNERVLIRAVHRGEVHYAVAGYWEGWYEWGEGVPIKPEESITHWMPISEPYDLV